MVLLLLLLLLFSLFIIIDNVDYIFSIPLLVIIIGIPNFAIIHNITTTNRIASINHIAIILCVRKKEYEGVQREGEILTSSM